MLRSWGGVGAGDLMILLAVVLLPLTLHPFEAGTERVGFLPNLAHN